MSGNTLNYFTKNIEKITELCIFHLLFFFRTHMLILFLIMIQKKFVNIEKQSFGISWFKKVSL